MKFEAVSKDEVYTIQHACRNSDNLKLLDDFAKSNVDCARVVDHNWADAKSGASSLRNSIKHYKYGGVKIAVRKEEIYLIKV